MKQTPYHDWILMMTRLDHLEMKHKELHARIESLIAEKAPEKFITNLKKEKLKIKDEIEKIRKEVL